MLVYTGHSFLSLDEILRRPEVVDLIEDFDLEYRGKRLQLVPRFRPSVDFGPTIEPRLVVSVSSPSLLERFYRRNHHKKNFKDVYSSDYYYKDLSISWD